MVIIEDMALEDQYAEVMVEMNMDAVDMVNMETMENIVKVLMEDADAI